MKTNQKHLIGQRGDSPVVSNDGVGLPQRVRHVLATHHPGLATRRLHLVVARAPHRLAVLLEAQLAYTCNFFFLYH